MRRDGHMTDNAVLWLWQTQTHKTGLKGNGFGAEFAANRCKSPAALRAGTLNAIYHRFTSFASKCSQ